VLEEVSREPTTVLILDDDDTFRRSLSRILTGAGYVCLGAATASEARARLDADARVAVLLCDIRIPGESGLELLATLSADFPDLAVIMTTGLDDPRAAEVAFETGAYGYLIKPFTPNEILIALAGARQRRRLEAGRPNQLRGLEQNVARLRTLHGVIAAMEAGPHDAAAAEENMERLVRAVSLPGEETGRHIERMSRCSALLANAVGFSDEAVEEIRLAAALHDVGKIGVPDIILLKPGPLSPEEHTAMRRHPRIGYQLLADSTSPLMRTAATIALGHHEWWDGSGYPRGSRGNDIPEVARIAAVADVFDALTSNSVVRPAIAVETATVMMNELRGRQFEPRLLDLFLERLDDVAAIRRAYPDREEEPPIRVLVVDDHETFVTNLLHLLDAERAVRVVATAVSVLAAEQAVVAYEPDVLLMDFELPDGDGIAALARIRALVPSAKVVMLTGRTSHEALIRAIDAGCAGFVGKTEPVDKLIDAIRAAHHGDTLTPVTDLPRLLDSLSPTSRGLGSDLGPRELEILRLVAGGLANKAIAQRLYISLNTVRNHVQHILQKLDAHSRLEAVATAVRENVIARDPQTAEQ
jgi:putative two-component system response regulator